MHRINANVIATIQRHKRRGLSERETQAALDREGIKVSLGTVHAVCAGEHPTVRVLEMSRPRRGVKRRGKKLSTRGPGARQPAAPAPELPPDEADAATLTRWIAEHEKLAKKAHAAGDHASYAALHRLLASALARRRNIRPPPPPDEGLQVDMDEVGRLAVAKLFAIVGEALGSEVAR